MIRANRNRFLDGLLYYYFRGMWRRTFHGIYVRGLEHVSSLSPDRPVIAYANHTNWWDLLMVFRLTRLISQKRFHGMMEEKQLKPYRFFSWIGAFSVDLSSPGKASTGLRYAVKLLREPSTLVWIFPQGQICSPLEPFTLRPGLEFLIRHSPTATILPCAFRYEFLRDDRPVALIEFGPAMNAQQTYSERLQNQIRELSDRLEEVARNRDLNGFTSLEKRALTINKRWEYLVCLLQGRLKEFNPNN